MLASLNMSEQHELTFTGFVNQPLAGTWKLVVADDLSGDTGTINSWTLAMCVQ